jgi:TolB-like protein/Flp pilus assembly protein TadD
MSPFWGELRRRNVYRVGMVYTIVAWLLLQIADVVLPTFGAPGWVMRVFTMLLILGLPIALIFAWAFELTPQGLMRTDDVPVNKSVTPVTGRRLNVVIIALLSLAVIVLVIINYVLPVVQPEVAQLDSEFETRDTERQLTENIRHSIAVLPFNDLSAGGENTRFFAVGIHDDLLTQLSKIAALKVVSRTSVLQYEDSTKTIPQIASELGVESVVEGSVLRAGDQVRINVQLINASNDQHLWAEAFQFELTATNIFDVQREVTTKIAEALKTALTPEERKRLEEIPTRNLDALFAYQQGRQLSDEDTVASVQASIPYLQRAVELDPDFGLAYVELATANFYLTNDNEAERLLNKALTLENPPAEAYATQAFFAAATSGDSTGVDLKLLERAVAMNPNSRDVLFMMAAGLSNQGRPEEALLYFEKSLAIDPLAYGDRVNYALTLHRLGRFAEAEAQLRKVIEFDSEYAYGHLELGNLYWETGRIAEAVPLIRQALALDPGESAYAGILGRVHLDLGDVATADRLISRIAAINPEARQGIIGRMLLNAHAGDIEAAANVAASVPGRYFLDLSLFIQRNGDLIGGHAQAARARYEKRFPELFGDELPAFDWRNYRAAIDLYLVLQKTGERERALVLLERCQSDIATMPIAGEYGKELADAEIFALLGDTDQALRALKKAFANGSRIRWWLWTERNPNLDSIRDEPEFQAIIQEVKADMAAQLKQVRKMEGRGELDPIPDAFAAQ